MCVVNKTRRFLAILVTVVTLVCMTGTIAYAEDDGGGDTGVTEYITSGALKDPFNNLLSEINGESGFGTDVADNAIFAPNSTLRKVWINNQGLIEKLYGVVFSFAMALTVAFFVVNLIRELQEGRWTADALIKSGIMLIAVTALMAYGYDLISGFIDIGTGLGQKILSVAGSGDMPTALVNQSYIDRINAHTGVITRFVEYISLFIASLAVKICYLYIQVVCYSRLIELYARAFLAPIAIADCYASGPNPTGIRYLRSFLAVCLQGVVIVAVMICFRLLSGAIATEASHGIIGNIVLIFAVVGFIGKSGSFAKELCGVG